MDTGGFCTALASAVARGWFPRPAPHGVRMVPPPWLDMRVPHRDPLEFNVFTCVAAEALGVALEDDRESVAEAVQAIGLDDVQADLIDLALRDRLALPGLRARLHVAIGWARA